MTEPIDKYTEQLTKKRIKLFVNEKRHFLLTSRFNEATLSENRQYKRRKNIGCIYCSPTPISSDVPLDSIMFVLEMNTDKNVIEGIGMVRNHAHVNKYNVYKDGNYNRYVFVGKNYISRQDMNEDEEEIMKAFDILCFTGNNHMKRGQGIKKFPTRMLYNCRNKIDLVEFIKGMFKRRI